MCGGETSAHVPKEGGGEPGGGGRGKGVGGPTIINFPAMAWMYNRGGQV